jgi:hypothetical protein
MFNSYLGPGLVPFVGKPFFCRCVSPLFVCNAILGRPPAASSRLTYLTRKRSEMFLKFVSSWYLYPKSHHADTFASPIPFQMTFSPSTNVNIYSLLSLFACIFALLRLFTLITYSNPFYTPTQIDLSYILEILCRPQNFHNTHKQSWNNLLKHRTLFSGILHTPQTLRKSVLHTRVLERLCPSPIQFSHLF